MRCRWKFAHLGIMSDFAWNWFRAGHWCLVITRKNQHVGMELSSLCGCLDSQCLFAEWGLAAYRKYYIVHQWKFPRSPGLGPPMS